MDDQLGLAGALEDETSQTFLAEWDRLVSSTNWEKGASSTSGARR